MSLDTRLYAAMENVFTCCQSKYLAAPVALLAKDW